MYTYLARLHNELYYVRLSRNLYVYYVHSSRTLYIHYVHLSRNLYVHYVRLRPTNLKWKVQSEILQVSDVALTRDTLAIHIFTTR